MKSKKLFAVALALGMPWGMCGAMAAQCTQFYPSDTEAEMCMAINIEFDDVSYGSPRYYKIGNSGRCVLVRDAMSCPAGYTRKRVALDDCSNTVQYWACECECANCNSDKAYSAAGPGYEQFTARSCDCSTGSPVCSSDTSYRCAVGYWGFSFNGTTGCTQCQSSEGANGTTKNPDSSQITYCYIPEGSGFGNSTGSGVYTSDCYYTN